MNDKIIFKMNDKIEGTDIYENQVNKGVISGFVNSLGYATVKIEGCCYGTVVDLTNNSVRKIKDN